MGAVSRQKLSDERLNTATGHTRADWHALLDAAGARDWKHPAIARWLVETHGVDGWWAQGITVGFEQEIGRRVPGQTADGTFSVSATRTVASTREATVGRAVSYLTAEFGEPTSSNLGSHFSTVRWRLDDGTIVAGVSASRPGRTLISLTWSKILDSGALEAAKSRLRGTLDGFEG